MTTDGLDIEVSELAEWLLAQPKTSLWTVDGEWTIMETITLPVSGKELVAVLETIAGAKGGKLRVSPPPGEPVPTSTKLDDWAEKYGEGGVTLGLAWLVGKVPGEIWLLTRDTIAEEISREAEKDIRAQGQSK